MRTHRYCKLLRAELQHFVLLTPDSLIPAGPSLWSLFWGHRLGSQCHTTASWFWPSDFREASANSRAAQTCYRVMRCSEVFQLIIQSTLETTDHGTGHTACTLFSVSGDQESYCNSLIKQVWERLHLTLQVLVSLQRQYRSKDLFHFQK